MIEGKIYVNGQLKSENEAMFRRITGYVEQRDMHMPLATVRESLLFSATLRLPKSVTREQRTEFVEELLDILELRSLADRIVGNEKYAGLSPGQLKLLTIGVELAANPSILFLDEPTSGSTPLSPPLPPSPPQPQRALSKRRAQHSAESVRL